MINDYTTEERSRTASDTFRYFLLKYLGEGTVSVFRDPICLAYNFQWKKKNKVVNAKVSDIEIMRNNNDLNVIEMVAKILKTEMEKTPKDICHYVMNKLLGKE